LKAKIGTIEAITTHDVGFEMLFYANPQPMWIFDVHALSILEVNAAAIKCYGYSREEFLNKTIKDLRPAEDVVLLEALLPAIKGNNTNNREFRHLTKSGLPLYVEITSYAVSYQGKSARIVYANNIDEHKELEGKLALTQRKLMQVLDTSLIGFIQVGFNWTITYWNKAAEALIGYRKNEIIGRYLWDLLPEIRHSDFNYYLEKALLQRTKVDFTDYFWPLQKWFSCIACPVDDGIIVHFRDVTEERQNREGLLEKIDQLKEVSYLNSHAIRKPIASLLGLTQLVTQEIVTDSEFKNIATLMHECSNELDEVVREVNRTVTNEDYLDGDNGTMEVFCFDALITQFAADVQHLYKQHHIVVVQSLKIDFYGNKQSVKVALKYLVDNAVKFSPVNSSIIIKSELLNHNVVLSVEDFGAGLSQKEMQGLFFLINQRKRASLSTGLLKVNEVCRKHHGNMWIESVYGQGSVFTMRFPISNLGMAKLSSKTKLLAFKQSSIDITYNEQQKCLVLNWSGFHNIYTVREGCLNALQLLEEYQCNKILNNNAEVLGGWMDACDWIVDKWFPVAQSAGLKYVAWVYAKCAFSNLSVKYASSAFKSDIITKQFSDVQQGLNWLGNPMAPVYN
jgi:PAS domain S-box-containing protein